MCSIENAVLFFISAQSLLSPRGQKIPLSGCAASFLSDQTNNEMNDLKYESELGVFEKTIDDNRYLPHGCLSALFTSETVLDENRCLYLYLSSLTEMKIFIGKDKVNFFLNLA